MPEKAIGEGAASFAVISPKLRSQENNVRLGTIKGLCERLLVKLSGSRRTQQIGDASSKR